MARLVCTVVPHPRVLGMDGGAVMAHRPTLVQNASTAMTPPFPAHCLLQREVGDGQRPDPLPRGAHLTGPNSKTPTVLASQ